MDTPNQSTPPTPAESPAPISEDLRRLKEDLARLRQNLGGQLAEKARAVQAKGQDAVGTVQKKVSERPLTSVLIALGVGVGLGLLIGAAMRRR